MFLADIDLTSSAVEGQSYNYWGEFVNMLLTLGFILILVFVSVWFLKRIMRSRIHTLNRSTGIKILERRALTTKSSLYLVEVLGRGVLIADSPSGISVLTEFPEEKDISKMLEALQQEETARVPFKEMMQRKMKKLARVKNDG